MRKKNLKIEIKKIAMERVKILFKLAIETFKENKFLAQRYTEMARRICMHYRVKLPIEYRRLICRHCKGLIIHGINCRVRLQRRRQPHIVITCLNCGSKSRFNLKKFIK